MKFSAKQIADFLKGTVEGNPDVLVSDFSKIEEGKQGTLSFLSNSKYEPFLYTTEASAVLVNKDFQPNSPVKATLIKVEDAYKSLAMLLDMVEQSKPKKKGVDALAYVSPSAKVGENVYVAPFAYVGDNVELGNNVQIYPHTFVGDNVKLADATILYAGVKIYSNCIIGKKCIIHAGAVIGADGFGFAPENGVYKKIPQIGNVVIEDNVEIGANSTIDCATMGSTIIRKGVKIDNLVHLAHNVEVDENTAIAAQCGVAGSTKIGKNCVFAGQVGVVGHVKIADKSIFGAQAGVSHGVKEENQIWIGSPILPVRKFKRVTAVNNNILELRDTVFELQKELKALKEQLGK